jgi:hypothetical protein
MEEDRDDLDVMLDAAKALYYDKLFREALAKYKAALLMAKNEAATLSVYMWIIECHENLKEVRNEEELENHQGNDFPLRMIRYGIFARRQSRW